MAKSTGRLSTVEISTDGGATYTAVGRLLDPTITFETHEIDATDNDSGAWEEILLGHGKWSIDAPFNYDEADAGQAAAVTAHFDKTLVKVRFRAKGAGNGNRQRVGDAYVVSLNEKGNTKEKADGGFRFAGTGAPTNSTQ